MLCYAMLCYAVLCYTMLCYAVLYYAVLMLRYGAQQESSVDSPLALCTYNTTLSVQKCDEEAEGTADSHVNVSNLCAVSICSPSAGKQ